MVTYTIKRKINKEIECLKSILIKIIYEFN